MQCAWLHSLEQKNQAKIETWVKNGIGIERAHNYIHAWSSFSLSFYPSNYVCLCEYKCALCIMHTVKCVRIPFFALWSLTLTFWLVLAFTFYFSCFITFYCIFYFLLFNNFLACFSSFRVSAQPNDFVSCDWVAYLLVWVCVVHFYIFVVFFYSFLFLLYFYVHRLCSFRCL